MQCFKIRHKIIFLRKAVQSVAFGFCNVLSEENVFFESKGPFRAVRFHRTSKKATPLRFLSLQRRAELRHCRLVSFSANSQYVVLLKIV